MNRLFAHLRRDQPAADESLSPEEQAAEDKKQRVIFHRDKVRNGPVKFSYPTSAEARRRAVRDEKSMRRKVNKRYRREWMQKRANIATLRGHLTILGVIECASSDTTFTVAQQKLSMEWVVGNFADRQDDGTLVLDDSMVERAIKNARQAFLDASGVKERADGTFVTNRPAATA